MKEIVDLENFVIRLQGKVISEPTWIEEKSTFEYHEDTIEVACILKLIRTVQSLYSMELLFQNGLFIDMSTLFRCVDDCVSEIYFLLENYPKMSRNVIRFLDEFFSKKVDKGIPDYPQPVEMKKIQNAMIRVLLGRDDFESIERKKRIHKIFSGYIHSSYSHIMEMFGPKGDFQRFNIDGIKSESEKGKRFPLIIETIKEVYYVLFFVADKFGEHDIQKEVWEYCKNM
jgi:hypothetical protein